MSADWQSTSHWHPSMGGAPPQPAVLRPLPPATSTILRYQAHQVAADPAHIRWRWDWSCPARGVESPRVYVTRTGARLAAWWWRRNVTRAETASTQGVADGQ